MKCPEVAAWAALSFDGRVIECPGDVRRSLVRWGKIGAGGNAMLLGGDGCLAPEILTEMLRAQTVAIFADRGRLHPDMARLLRQHGRCVVFTTEAMPAGRRKCLGNWADVRVEPRGRSVDLHRALFLLAGEYGVRRALCAGSPVLLRLLAEERLLSKLHVEFLPRVIGGARTPTLIGLVAESLLARSIRLRLEKFDVRGERCFVTYSVPGRRKVLDDTRGARR